MADDASRDASSEYIAIRFRLTDRDQFLSEFKSVQNAIGAAVKSVEKAAATAQREISKNLQKQSMGIRDAGMGLDRYLTDIDKKLAPVPTRLGKIFDGVVVPAGRMAKNVGTAFVAMSDGIEKTVKRASRSILNLRNLVVGVLAAQIGKAVLKMGADFEQGMAEVSTLVDTATTSVQGLKDGLLDLSQRVPQDVGDLTGALYQAISAGIDPSKALQFVEASAKAATAGVSDAATAVDLFTTVINSYGFAVDDVGKISDIVFEMIRLGKTDLDRIAQSMGYVASQGKLANVSFEEMAAAMTALTLAGRTTEQAAQELNQLLIKITGPTEIAKKEAEKLGIAWDESTLAAKGLFGFMEELSKRTDISAESMKHLTEDAGAMRAMAILIGPGLEKFRTLLDNMGDAAGATDRAFQKMMKSLQNQATIIKNRVIAVIQRAFQDSQKDIEAALSAINAAFMSTSGSMGDAVSGMISTVAKLVEAMAELRVVIVDLLKLFAALFVAGKIGAFAKAMKGAATAMAAFATSASVTVGAFYGASGLIAVVAAAALAFDHFARSAQDAFAAYNDFNASLNESLNLNVERMRELRRINAEFAAGKITADEASKQKDALFGREGLPKPTGGGGAKKTGEDGEDSVKDAIEAYRQQLEARKQAHMDELQIAKAYYDKLLSMEGVTAAQRAQIEEIYQDTVAQIHADIAEEEKAANFEAFKAKFEALQDDLQKERDAADDRVAVIKREQRERQQIIDEAYRADILGARDAAAMREQIEKDATKKIREERARRASEIIDMLPAPSEIADWAKAVAGGLEGILLKVVDTVGGAIGRNIMSPIKSVLGDIESLTGLETKTSLGTDYQRDPRLDSQFAATRDEALRDMLQRYRDARARGDDEAARHAQRGEIATGTGVEQSPINAAMDDIEMRVKGWVPRAISALRAMGARLPGILQGAARRMASMRGELLSAIRKNVPAILGAAANAATEFAVTQFQILTVKLPSYVLTAAVIAGRALLRLVPAVIRALPDAIRTLIDVTADLLPELVSEAILLIPDIVLAYIEALPRIWDAIIIKGIPKIIGALVETILVAVPRAFSKAISGTVDSLAKVFGSAAWRGLRDAFKKVVHWLKKQLDKITPGTGGSFFGSFFGNFPTGGDIVDAASDVGGGIKDTFSQATGINLAKGGVAGVGHTPAYASAVARLNRLMSSPNEVAGLMYRGEMVLDTATSQKLMAALGGTRGTIDRNGQRGTIDRNGFGDQFVNIQISAEVLASRSAGDWLDDALYKLSRQPGRKININPDKGAR